MPMPRTPSKKGGRRPAPTEAAPSKPRKARASAPGTPAASVASAAPAPASSERQEAVVPAPARRQYVYGIIPAPASPEPRFGPIGLGVIPAEVFTVRHRALAAVVSDGPEGVPDATRDNLLTHERVNEAVMREHTVLPMAFGTVLRSREDVEELLRAGHDVFEATLARVAGKLELGLKVFYMARDGEAVRERAARDAASLVEALRTVAVDVRVSAPVGERMVLNASCLVERERVAAFDARVKSLAASHEELTFRSTGPWPPYHFVDLRVGLERAEG